MFRLFFAISVLYTDVTVPSVAAQALARVVLVCSVRDRHSSACYRAPVSSFLLIDMLWTLLLFSFIVYLLYTTYRDVSRLPPGPLPLPIIGNLFTSLHPPALVLDLARLSKQFGGFFTIRMPYSVVNIGSFDVLKRAYARGLSFVLIDEKDNVVGDDFADRSTSNALRKIRGMEDGIVMSSGEYWKTQRRFDYLLSIRSRPL